MAAESNKQTLSEYIESRGTSRLPHEIQIDASDVVLKKIIDFQGAPSRDDLLDLLLPQQKLPYTWPDVERTLVKLGDELETIQREANDDFDKLLPDEHQLRLSQLTASLQEIQQQVLRLQCNINQTRQQQQEMRRLCNEETILNRRQVNQAEKQLQKSLQESKFREVLEFFNLFVIHLDASVAATRLNMSRLAVANPTQPFDWSTYHQSVYLLRACGKALIDVDKFERFYQFYGAFKTIALRTPIKQLDMNNFIEFPGMYSVETQLNVVTGQAGEHVATPYGQFVSEARVDEQLHSVAQVRYELFGQLMDRIGSITKDCCRLIIDLNLSFIEAHFTSGINIDHLNGCETTLAAAAAAAAAPQPEPGAGPTEALPSYAFSPQPYITQIGQHVLTLRKQTEQYDQIDNRPLKLALDYLRHADQAAAAAANLKARPPTGVAEIILKCIARHCIRSLIGRTTRSVLAQLTPNGKRQLATDAMYLDNVLEDLDLLEAGDVSVGKFKLLLELR